MTLSSLQDATGAGIIVISRVEQKADTVKSPYGRNLYFFSKLIIKYKKNRLLLHCKLNLHKKPNHD